MTDRELIEKALRVAVLSLQAIETDKDCSINEAALVGDLRTLASWVKDGAVTPSGLVRPVFVPGSGSEIDRIVQRWGPS